MCQPASHVYPRSETHCKYKHGIENSYVTKCVTECLWKLLEDDRETSLLPYTIDNIHGTGFGNLSRERIERVQNEVANMCYGNSHLTGAKMLLPLYTSHSFYI